MRRIGVSLAGGARLFDDPDGDGRESGSDVGELAFGDPEFGDGLGFLVALFEDGRLDAEFPFRVSHSDDETEEFHGSELDGFAEGGSGDVDCLELLALRADGVGEAADFRLAWSFAVGSRGWDDEADGRDFLGELSEDGVRAIDGGAEADEFLVDLSGSFVLEN